ncbi:MAG: hypothetical protein ACRCXM_17210 [Beijerinckiaceae bacterium]
MPKFQPGVSGNPGGKSAETIRLEREAADIALRMRLKWLKALEAKADAGDEAAMETLSTEALNLAKHSEDRAHGTPRQSVEHMGEGGGPVEITEIRRVIVRPDGST